MASLIKSQIIKRLSKFVKNLSSNQINLSTLKGEGELSSIDLDEQALEDVIELPTWLRIRRATCGRVFIKIPWTNLKTLPIQLQLDDVNIEIETCEKLRDLHNSNESPSANDPLVGKYGFTNRVIDGISFTITNLTFCVKAQGFKATIFLPSLEIYSTTPYGKRVDTLKLTRLSNAAKDHILLFKEISWQNARIEASSNDSSMAAAAIRLITNASRIRISMKKNLQDSTMVTSRVMIYFDDLLSVVNDAQLKSALNAYKEITQLMKHASEQRKRIAGDKLTKLEQQQQQLSSFQPRPPTTGLHDTMNSPNFQQQLNDTFKHYDIVETSLHFNIKRLDIHIISDSDILKSDVQQMCNRLAESGALQITLANLSIDHYPYHQHGSSKTHWVKYSEMLTLNRDEWAVRLKDEWNEQVNCAKNNVSSDETSVKLEKALRTNRIRLFESCTVVNIDDIVLYPVSLNTNSTKHQQQKRRRPLVTSDRTQYQLPEFLGIIHMQHTEYYYPLPYAFPVPNSDLYIQIMPIVIRVDFATFGWLDAFVSSISMTIDNSGVLKTAKSNVDIEHVAIKIEAMLPRIVICSDIFSNADQLQKSTHDMNLAADIFTGEETSDMNNLEMLELNVSKILLTNCRTESTSSRTRLDQHVELFSKEKFFQLSEWPLESEVMNNPRISSVFRKHPYETYLYSNPLAKKIGIILPESPSSNIALHSYYSMTTDSLKKAAKYDVWHFNADSVYIDFTPISLSESVRFAKQNVTDSFSISGWVVLNEKANDYINTSIWANVLTILEAPSLLKMSQQQYTFVMRLVDEFGLFMDVLERNKIQTRLIRQQVQASSSMSNVSSNELKMTMCLMCPSTFTLAVLDGLEHAMINLSKLVSGTDSSETDAEPTTSYDTSNLKFDLDSMTSSTATNTKSEFFSIVACEDNKTTNNNPNKSFNSSGQKKLKPEEITTHGLETISKGSHGSLLSSLANNTDNGDEMSAQWDQLSEDLDADLDPALLSSDDEQQQSQQQTKPARIELDDDNISLAEKNKSNNIVIGTNALESVNGVFIKLNQIKLYIAENEGKFNKPFYVAGNIKYIRIDEFQSLKFDSIKPKLFENESPDVNNHECVPPISIRIDLPKHESNPLPIVTLKMEDRCFTITSHAIDVIVQNLEEQKLKKIKPPKTVPINVYLDNVRLTLELINDSSKTNDNVNSKPPLKLNIQQMRIFRQFDGEITVETPESQDEIVKTVPLKSNSDANDVEEKLHLADMIRLENERLRAELIAHKKEITVLRGERDSLMNTISKLDIELTQAEHQRMMQQQQPSPRKR